MNKPYRDAFGNPIYMLDVRTATQFVLRSGQASPTLLVLNLKFGYLKAVRVIQLLKDAKVINFRGAVILKNEDAAINAALRQLKKGRKS